MTLSTRVHIKAPVNPERLFLRLLGVLESSPAFVPAWEQPEETPFRTTPGPLRLGRATYSHRRKGELLFLGDGTPYCHHRTGEQFRAEDSRYASTLGQGLAAILEVTYGDDGPFDWLEGHRDEGEQLGEWDVCAVAVDFDTAYGYRTPSGAGCDDLHALLVLITASHLREEGVGGAAWAWHNEYRGTWHPLAELVSFGDPLLAAKDFPLAHDLLTEVTG